MMRIETGRRSAYLNDRSEWAEWNRKTGEIVKAHGSALD